MAKKKNTVILSTRDELTRICMDEVMYVESDGNYVRLCFRSGRSVEVLASMQNIEHLVLNLDNVSFLRVGRRHIINLSYLSQINTMRRTITLADDSTKETATLSVSKESITILKDSLSSQSLTPIPDFHTSNGKMEAYIDD